VNGGGTVHAMVPTWVGGAGPPAEIGISPLLRSSAGRTRTGASSAPAAKSESHPRSGTGASEAGGGTTDGQSVVVPGFAGATLVSATDQPQNSRSRDLATSLKGAPTAITRLFLSHEPSTRIDVLGSTLIAGSLEPSSNVPRNRTQYSDPHWTQDIHTKGTASFLVYYIGPMLAQRKQMPRKDSIYCRLLNLY
jgi:hypothetical protein